MKRLITISLAALFSTPVFACGPMMNSGSGTESHHHQTSPGRDKYTKQRMQELKRRRQQQRQQGTGPDMGTSAISKMQQANDPLAVTAADRHRDAVRKQQLIDAIEFLALKKERGELSPKGQAKLNALIQQYRTNYTRGY